MSGARTLQVLAMLGGMIAWAVQFTVIYGVTSTLCGRGWADVSLLGTGVVQATIIVTTLVALAATASIFFLLFRIHRHEDGQLVSAASVFMTQAGILINGLSLVAILWQGVPGLILPACA
jgi:hypothetical protein